MVCLVSRCIMWFWRGPLWMEPSLPVPTEVGQDQSGADLPLRSSAGAGQRSLQQQGDRCETALTVCTVCIFINMTKCCFQVTSCTSRSPPPVSLTTGLPSRVTHWNQPIVPILAKWASLSSRLLEWTFKSWSFKSILRFWILPERWMCKLVSHCLYIVKLVSFTNPYLISGTYRL